MSRQAQNFPPRTIYMETCQKVCKQNNIPLRLINVSYHLAYFHMYFSSDRLSAHIMKYNFLYYTFWGYREGIITEHGYRLPKPAFVQVSLKCIT